MKPVESLTREEALLELEELARRILELDVAYHTHDMPLLTDAEYDAVRQRNAQIEKRFPDLVLSTSPSFRVGAQLAQGFAKRKHLKPVLSLSNVFSAVQLKEFMQKLYHFLGEDTPIQMVAEPKIDGLSFSIIYKNGILEYALTRGNGLEGEDITDNIKTIVEVPLRLRTLTPPELLEVRGEVYMSKEAFFKLNQEQTERKEKTFANPRNAAAGSLRQLDARITAQRKLQIFAYALGEYKGIEFDTHWDFLNKLKEFGFPVNPLIKKCESLEAMLAFFDDIGKKRADLPYDIDGIVYKVNDLNLQKRLGFIARAPRWAIAHKFPPEQALTQIEKIVVQVGRTGALTPVAQVVPVNIGGVIVRRATLHNFEEIERKDIREGDIVLLQRAGDVIPQILDVQFDKRSIGSQKYIVPTHCPVCGAVAKKEGEEAILYCTAGLTCNAQVVESIKHFVSSNALNIEGLGNKYIQLFFEWGWIKNPVDLFYLEERYAQELKCREGWGEKSANNLFSALKKVQEGITLERFIYALGIREIGEATAKVLARFFGTWKNFRTLMSQDDAGSYLEQIEGIGEIMAKNIIDFFAEEHQKSILDALENLIYIIPYQVLDVQKTSFTGKQVVFTGTLNMTRQEAKDKALRAGAKVTGSVTSKTDFVIAGEKAGSKLEMAEKLGIQIISEDEFLNLLEKDMHA